MCVGKLVAEGGLRIPRKGFRTSQTGAPRNAVALWPGKVVLKVIPRSCVECVRGPIKKAGRWWRVRRPRLIWTAPQPWMGWVGLWGFLWWAPSATRKDHHGVSSGWSSVWHRSNTGLSSTQYEQIPIILGVRPFWLNPFFFSVNNISAGLWLNCISSVEITLFLLADILLQHRALFQY